LFVFPVAPIAMISSVFRAAWDPAAFGIACRIVSFASLLMGAQNSARIEFSTPSALSQSPTGMLFCLVGGGSEINLTSNSSLGGVWSGGVLLDGSDAAAVGPTDAFWATKPASFSSFEVGSLVDFIATDAFYGRDYDEHLLDYISSSHPEVSAANVSGANCFLLSGAFSPDSRYEVQVSFQNPTSAQGNIGVWGAPVAWNTSGIYSPRLTVLGPKQGVVCRPRSSLDTALGSSSPELPNGPTSCDPGRALDSRFSGDCHDCRCFAHECPSYLAAVSVASCTCPPTYIRTPVGPHPCRRRSTLGNASSDADHARELCALFSHHYSRLLDGDLSDRLVSSSFLRSFFELAQPLVDPELALKTVEEFERDYVRDSRRPSDPTRRKGVADVCTRCDPGSNKFRSGEADISLDGRGDFRFRARNTFRAIGLLLARSRAKYSCKGLEPDQDTALDQSHEGAYGDWRLLNS
jgi:hypothetical protein